MRIKTLLSVALASALLIPVAHASKKNVLPDSCGDAKIEFDVETSAGNPTATPLAEGMARIVFIENYDKGFMARSVITRFAVDGKWVGAAKPSSYFVVDLPAGEHKLCGSVKGKSEYIGMETLTAEAGKTYYWEAKYEMLFGAVRTVSTPQGTSASRPHTLDAGFTLVTEDEGKFRVKASDNVKATPKKDE